MRIANRLALALVASVGISASALLAADALPPAQAPAAIAAPAATASAKVTPSDRWFIAKSEEGNERPMGWLRITVKESGQAAAPVAVTYELTILSGNRTTIVTLENLCLNDEWQSPVKMTGNVDGEQQFGTITVVRADPKSTAGKATIVSAIGQKRNLDVPEHTLLFFAPLDIVTRMPLDKEKKLEFPWMEISGENIQTCTISYAGEEEIDTNGVKQKVSKFVQSPKSCTYWVNDKHELVKADIDHGILTPATAVEAKKAYTAPAAPKAATAPATKYDAGFKALLEKKYDVAIDNYNEFIAANKDSQLVPYAMYSIAACYKSKMDNAKAMEGYQKLIDQFPVSQPTEWAKVDMEVLKKDLLARPTTTTAPTTEAEAKKMVQPKDTAATNAAPAAPKVGAMRQTMYDAASSAQEDKKYDVAIDNYIQFIKANKDSAMIPYAMYNIALCYKGKMNQAEAMAIYQKLRDQYPTSTPAEWAKIDMEALKKNSLVVPTTTTTPTVMAQPPQK